MGEEENLSCRLCGKVGFIRLSNDLMNVKIDLLNLVRERLHRTFSEGSVPVPSRRQAQAGGDVHQPQGD